MISRPTWSPRARSGPSLVRAGLRASTGDHLVVLDLDRHYSPESLTQVIAPVRTGEFDLAVAVPATGRSRLACWSGSGFSLRSISRLFLGTSRCFLGPVRARSLRLGPRRQRRPGERLEPGSRLTAATTGAVHRRAGRRRRSLPIAAGWFRGPAPAQAAPRRPLRQLLTARSILHGRRLGHDRRPDVLRPLAVAVLLHLVGGPAIGPLRLLVASRDRRRACRSRSRWSGTSP